MKRANEPDGTKTTISCAYDTTSQCVKMSITDPTGDGPTHRNKNVFLTASSWTNPSTGGIVSQPFGFVRMVWNGASEVSYLNWATNSGGVDTHYIYQGGNSLYRYLAASNEPQETDYATAFNVANDPSTYTWETGPKYSTSNFHLTAETDQLGRTVSLTLDPSTSAVTKRTYPADPAVTYETTTYNSFMEPLTYTDRLGRETVYTYDTNGNMLTKTGVRKEDILNIKL